LQRNASPGVPGELNLSVGVGSDRNAGHMTIDW
jgi:hypothetical protein